MSGRQGPGQRPAVRIQLPLLDRLIDTAPDQQRDPPASAHDTMQALRAAVRRDLEALLNARRRWQSWPEAWRELLASPVGYGLPDLSSGALSDAKRRDAFRAWCSSTGVAGFDISTDNDPIVPLTRIFSGRAASVRRGTR